jgi:hypothetical protein
LNIVPKRYKHGYKGVQRPLKNVVMAMMQRRKRSPKAGPKKAKHIVPSHFNWPTIPSAKPPKPALPIDNWRDADLADKTARRNAGLDSEEGSRIQIGLALIETRLQAINLPRMRSPKRK